MNAKNKRGWTPLDIAARKGFLQVAQQLTSCGAFLSFLVFSSIYMYLFCDEVVAEMVMRLGCMHV